MILREYPYNDTKLTVVWLEEKDLPVSAKYKLKWNDELRQRLDWLYGNVRPRLCLVCNRAFAEFHLHHGIVSRRDVMGWPKAKRFLIDVELNLIPLHGHCHLDKSPTREACWEYQCSFYGSEIMNEWYNTLPFKVPPRRF